MSDDRIAARPVGAGLADLRAYAGVRVAVLGATGFIGRRLTRSLSTLQTDLRLIVRDEAAARSIFDTEDHRHQLFKADLSQADAVSAVLHEANPTVTFNLAGYGIRRDERDLEQAFQINTALPGLVCESIALIRDAAASWPGQEIVHVGTALEYGTIHGDLREDSEPRPTTLYGRSKLAGTRRLADCCLRLKVRGVTGRLFTIYGPGEEPGRLLPSLLDTAQSGRPLPLTAGAQRRDFTFVDDAVEGLLRLGLSQAAPGEIVNVATGKLTTVREFVEIAADELSVAQDLLQFGALPTRDEEQEHDPVNTRRLQALTNWRPQTDIRSGIQRTARRQQEFPSGLGPSQSGRNVAAN